MITKLKKKFIAIAMAAVISVVAVLMITINVFYYNQMSSSSDQMLNMLIHHGGSMDDFKEMPPEEFDHFKPGQGDPFDDMYKRGDFTPETPFETRFFSVEILDDGNTKVNLTQIRAIDQKTAESMAEELAEKGKTEGYYGNYRYATEDTPSGTKYLFIDCTREINSFRRFLTISVWVSLLGIGVVFIAVTLLSEKAIRPIAESYRKQKEFISNASHEIKTPVAIIASSTDVIEMENGETKWTDNIKSQVSRLNEMTNSLISLTRMEDSGAQNMPKEEFALSDAVNDTLSAFTDIAQQNGFEVISEIEPDLQYNGNEKSIRSLVTILADNAVNYAAKGSPIRFSLQSQGKKIVFTTENAAEGLFPGKQDKLFERFYRVGNKKNDESNGYGIGLSMAKSIVEAHKGKIEAVSPDGRSLKMTVTL